MLIDMTQEDIKKRLILALDVLFAVDTYILEVNSSERSICHRLAIHLAGLFPEYDVDCEYNRDGELVKKLSLDIEDVKSNELKAVTVFPDIIVHKRGPCNHRQREL